MTNTQNQHSHESLTRAVSGQSVMNYAAIFEGFEAKGIPPADIKPRENVFTFWAWKGLGRRVRKGEHGVKATTFVAVSDKQDASTGEKKSGYRLPRTVTVFHISQTELESPAGNPPADVPRIPCKADCHCANCRPDLFIGTDLDTSERDAEDAHRAHFQD